METHVTTAPYRIQGAQLLKNFFNVALKSLEKGEYEFNKDFIEKNYVDLSENMTISPEGLNKRLKVLARALQAAFVAIGYTNTSFSYGEEFKIIVKV